MDKNFECCSTTLIHEDIVAAVRDKMPLEHTFYELSEFFKVFADMTRIKILHALSCSEMCVCDIAALLGATHSAVSHQLRILKQARLVKFRKDGKVVYYSLDDEHIKSIFECGLSHISEK